MVSIVFVLTYVMKSSAIDIQLISFKTDIKADARFIARFTQAP